MDFKVDIQKITNSYMTYAEIVRLYEKKDHLIKRTNMTDEQKQEVIEFFNKHREQESQISGDEWNKPELLTYERFKQVMDAFNNRNTKSRANKIANKVGIAGLTEGEDYVDWGEFNDELLGKFHTYTPLSHLGAKTIAGKTVKPVNPDKDSAGWCIGWSGNDSYWKDYFFEDEESFLVLCGENIPTKKVCIEIENVEDISSTTVTVWDYYDRSWSLEQFLDKVSSDDTHSDIYMSTENLENLILDLCKKAKEISDNLRESKLKEIKETEKLVFLSRTRGLEIKNLTYRGYDFPMIEMGERPEGKVFGSYYLTADEVPFSLKYEGEVYDYGCNRWDISIVRQWLNSDKPAGEWFKEYEVNGYKVDWEITYTNTKNFIKNTDGFLKIVGLSKSQLNPVKNVTYTQEGKKIITEDYVWIPSLTELFIPSKLKEGEPLEYWKKLLGNNASQASYIDFSQEARDLRVMKLCDTRETDWYWTRSIDSSYLDFVDSWGSVYKVCACSIKRLLVLMCFKS